MKRPFGVFFALIIFSLPLAAWSHSARRVEPGIVPVTRGQEYVREIPPGAIESILRTNEPQAEIRGNDLLQTRVEYLPDFIDTGALAGTDPESQRNKSVDRKAGMDRTPHGQ